MEHNMNAHAESCPLHMSLECECGLHQIVSRLSVAAACTVKTRDDLWHMTRAA